jgi:hypothetical protein
MNDISPETISGLTWYAEVRRLALAQIREFRPAADLAQMRLAHGLYLMHLQSLLDLAADADPDLPARWQAGLDGLGGRFGENNAAYLRELRNSVVHRGDDIAMRGTIVNGYTVALAPNQLWGRTTRKGRSGPYEPFEPLLWDMFAAVERVLPNVLEPLVHRIERQLLNFDEAEARRQYLEAVQGETFMPDRVKRMAIEQACQIPFAKINAHRFAEVQRLLGKPGPIDPLEPPAS